MSYLERNSRLIAETGVNLNIQRGATRGESGNILFSSVGWYPSQEIGTDVYVGMKESKYKESSSAGEMLKERFVFELAVMSVVAENMPHLLPELRWSTGYFVVKKAQQWPLL